MTAIALGAAGNRRCRTARRDYLATASARLDPGEVALERPLPRRAREAPVAIARDAGVGLDHAAVLDLVERVRHQDVGHREGLGGDELPAVEPAVQVGEVALRPAKRELAVFRRLVVLRHEADEQ